MKKFTDTELAAATLVLGDIRRAGVIATRAYLRHVHGITDHVSTWSSEGFVIQMYRYQTNQPDWCMPEMRALS